MSGNIIREDLTLVGSHDVFEANEPCAAEQVSISSTFYASFFVQNCFAQLFSYYSLAQNFLAKEYQLKS
jgi:hypothetical protein